MTTAKAVSESLAEALGRSFASVESYGLVLRKFGWWQAAKRGRGARPMTSMEAAKLLLAVMSEGPSDLAGPDGTGFFLRYANLALLPSLRDDAVIAAVRDEIGVARNGEFLDYLDGFVRLFRDGRATDLIFHAPYDEGQVDEWVWDGPGIDVRVKGPFPLASISFLLTREFCDRHGLSQEPGRCLIPFVDQMYGWAADAEEAGAPDGAFSDAIEAIRKQHSRGVQFERAIGGREVEAVASVLEKPEATK